MAGFLIKPSDPLNEPNFIRVQSKIKQGNGWKLTWCPPTDVFETSEKIFIRIEIAGMKQSEFDINFEDNYLIVRGVRTESREKRAFQQMEIRYGEFTSGISLPKGLSMDKAEAEYEDGFLLISISYSKVTTIQIKG